MANDDNNSFHSFQNDNTTSALAKYQDIVVGNRKLSKLIKQELLTFFLASLPGAPGLLLRQRLYPLIFAQMGRKTLIGHGVTLKQPGKIFLSNSCIIDDYVNLCVRGSEESKIEINDNTFIGRNSEIKLREGTIFIDSYSSIGSQCRIGTASGHTRIGKYVLTAAYCYIGAGNHKTDRLDIPIPLQPFDSKGGVTIGDDVWIGANTTIADGVTIGKGCIIGAHSFVNKDLPDYSIAYGCPAKIHKIRKAEEMSTSQR